jgi:protein gp37
VITGAESGRGARPMDEDWVRNLRDQCTEAGVAFFYKQDFKKGKKISLPELDGRQWTEFPSPRRTANV